MKRYFIEDAKVGITEGGIACGPVSGPVIATIKFKEDSMSHWLTLVEFDGIPNVYLFDKNMHETLVDQDFDDDDLSDYMNAHFIDEFNGIQFDVDYSTTFESFAEEPENPAIPLIRYLIALVRCSTDEVNDLIQMALGKYADELDIPTSDVEEEFMDENEEDFTGVYDEDDIEDDDD